MQKRMLWRQQAANEKRRSIRCYNNKKGNSIWNTDEVDQLRNDVHRILGNEEWKQILEDHRSTKYMRNIIAVWGSDVKTHWGELACIDPY